MTHKNKIIAKLKPGYGFLDDSVLVS